MINTTTFVQSIEETYGKYPALIRSAVQSWASGLSEDELMALLQVVVEYHSLQFRTPPSIPELKKYMDIADEIIIEQRLKRNALENYREHQFLLESSEKSDTTTLADFMHMVSEKLRRGINPAKDQEIIDLMKTLE